MISREIIGTKERVYDGCPTMMGEQILIEAEERSLWARCLSALRTQIAESALNTWFSALDILESDGSEMIIGVPNDFVLEYVSHHYRQIIEKTLGDILLRPVRVSFTVAARRISKYSNPNPVVAPIRPGRPLQRLPRRKPNGPGTALPYVSKSPCP